MKAGCIKDQHLTLHNEYSHIMGRKKSYDGIGAAQTDSTPITCATIPNGRTTAAA